MEFMLASHPHDCASCRSYLKCELQAMMQYLNAVHSRMREVEKATIKINTINPLIDREMERCILCGRCVRVCKDVRGVGILQVNRKGDEFYCGTENDLPLADAGCRFCSACVEVCPTGALQDRDGVFRKDLQREEALIPCTAECPAHIDIPAYVRYVKEGKYAEADAVIREKVPFPHALGYVCMHFCETACKRTTLNEAVSIRDLKRFAVENDKELIWKKNSRQEPDTGKKVAVIGAGPAGLTAALYLRKQGHDVTVYEQYEKAGGYMMYGIPEYRLPKADLQKEIDHITDTGVVLKTNTKVESIESLKAEGYDAILMANGTSIGKKVRLPGVEFGHNYTAAEFLRNAVMGIKTEGIGEGQKVIVLGGGNVAFDAARVARRQGAEVEVFCLEPRDGMLCDEEEVLQAQEEGIIVHNSTTNIAILGSAEKLEGLKYAQISSFAFGPKGLEVNVIEGTEAVCPGDTFIFAFGQITGLDATFGVEINKFGYPVYDSPKHTTSTEGVFVAGDVVTGTKSVIQAIEGGREAASEIDVYLGGNGDISEVLLEREPHNPNIGKIEEFGKIARNHSEIEKVENRADNFNLVDFGLSEEQAQCEGSRCLQCDLRCDITRTKMWSEYA
jgi:NADPH-dependent glutamate synthase beta subunit-like oxidoreductase/Pyruvate/2-oxoacid:ferredoxin oxidoreductase delta subunit